MFRRITSAMLASALALGCHDPNQDRDNTPWCTKVCAPYPVVSCDWGGNAGDKVTCGFHPASSASAQPVGER